MKTPSEVATIALYPKQSAHRRLFALWYFTALMTLWNVAGHTFLGFEQPWAAPFVGVATAVLAQLFLEYVDAKANRRTPRYSGGVADFLNFLPPAIISGFACAMLLYANERLPPIVFAAVLSIASKVLIRVPLANGKWTHVLNPSNCGIIVTLLLLPSVGQAPPYHFTENITGAWHWALPGAIMLTGIIVHGFATGRLPLCVAWLAAFFLQGIVRAWLAGDYWYVPLTPMSSAGFILFTLYMIPDPATTPIAPARQVLFGAAVALAYAIFQSNHIVYGLFLALASVCLVRGALIALFFRPAAQSTAARPLQAPHLADRARTPAPERMPEHA